MANILLIEDDTALQDAYSFILKSEEHTVTSAYNGDEGLKCTKNNTYDLILLDIHMPVMDGWEFLRRYSAHRESKTKVIIFSNMVEPDTQKQATEYGVYRSVLKSSMTPHDMIKLVRAALK